MNKEKIYFFRHYVMPVALSWLANDTYGSVGEQDREDFEKDFNEILNLALVGLKYKAQLPQEGTTKGTPYLKEYATADPDTAIGGLREMGDNLLREIHSRAMSRMGDCISRQAAIDALAKVAREKFNLSDEYNHYLAGLMDGEVAIKNLPSIQPEQNWIPCSERLPKKDGRYQVTRYDYVANTEFIDILWYEENLWWNRHSTGDYAVTAWMPLPEPYKEGETI